MPTTSLHAFSWPRLVARPRARRSRRPQCISDGKLRGSLVSHEPCPHAHVRARGHAVAWGWAARVHTCPLNRQHSTDGSRCDVRGAQSVALVTVQSRVYTDVLDIRWFVQVQVRYRCVLACALASATVAGSLSASHSLISLSCCGVCDALGHANRAPRPRDASHASLSHHRAGRPLLTWRLGHAPLQGFLGHASSPREVHSQSHGHRLSGQWY